MTKITKIGQKGIELIKSFEGFSSKPYQCPAGIWTIGYGSTFYFDTKKHVRPDDIGISKSEAERLLIGHINNVFSPLVDKLCRDDLIQNQFDALVSFVYNTGGGYSDKFGKYHYYDLFQIVNSKEPISFLKEYWQRCAITANKKPLAGLIRRRISEVDLYCNNSI